MDSSSSSSSIGGSKWDDLDERFYTTTLIVFLLLTPLTLLLLRRLTAPYGRHVRHGWGPTLPALDGWILMESPALWVSFLVAATGRHRSDAAPTVLLRLYQLHYLHRALVYPFRVRGGARKRMPWAVAAAGFLFNVANAYLQARWVSHHGEYPPGWLRGPRFLLGAGLFAAGMGVNVWADSVLIALRRSAGDAGYKVPRGGLYELVACPNYLGEAVEWLGWAVMTWSLPGLAFFLATLANLVPRAVAHREWYKNKFPDFPRDRKAVVPYLL